MCFPVYKADYNGISFTKHSFKANTNIVPVFFNKCNIPPGNIKL